MVVRMKVPSVSEPVVELIVAEFGGMYCQWRNQLWQNLEEGTVGFMTSYWQSWEEGTVSVVTSYGSLEEGAISVRTSSGRIWRKVPSVL